MTIDRKSVVQGKSVDLGGRRIIKKKKKPRGMETKAQESERMRSATIRSRTVSKVWKEDMHRPDKRDTNV